MSRQDFTVFGTASEFTELVAVIKEQARREVLAHLRAKVDGLRYTCATPECNSTVDIGDVLALIDEAAP